MWLAFFTGRGVYGAFHMVEKSLAQRSDPRLAGEYAALLTTVFADTNQLESAREQSDAAQAALDESFPHYMFVRYESAWLAYLDGDLEGSRASLTRLREDRPDDPSAAGWAALGMSMIDLSAGMPRSIIQRTARIVDRFGADLPRPVFMLLAVLADAHMALGHLDEAATVAERCSKSSRTPISTS